MRKKNRLLKDILVFGVIMLFFGASTISAINNKNETINFIYNIKNPSPDIETFYPSHDAYIKHDVPDGNLGSHEYFNTRNEYGAYGNPGWEWDGLIRFDISSLPSRADIISAKLYIYYFDYWDTNPVNRPIRLYKITSDWDEETVTWNTQPTCSPQTSASCPVLGFFGWMVWEVTGDVQDFVDGDNNYGWKITDDNYWGWYDIPTSRFRTKEYVGNGDDYKPYLEIEFTKSRNRVITNNLFLQFLERFPNLFPIIRNLLGFH